MKPLEVFENTRDRAQGLLDLYLTIHNRRERAIRADWKRKFCTLMHWPQQEALHRIDGHRAILILRAGAKVPVEDFQAEVLTELLRAAHAIIVSALDRYVHEVVIQNLLKALRKSGAANNGALRKLRVPLIIAQEAVTAARGGKGVAVKASKRPMTLIRQGMQEVLHSDMTCQSPAEISDALAMIGVSKLWASCEPHMGLKAELLKLRLSRIVRRRNVIVHEGDIERRLKGGKVRLHSIKDGDVQNDIQWIDSLVKAIELEIHAQVG